MKALVFLDIDGTILPEGKTKIASDVVGTIKRVKENGHVPFICTGRNYGSALDIIEQLDIDSYVTSNGQQVTVEGKTIYSDYFQEEDLKNVCELIKEHTPHLAMENNKGLNVEDSPEGRNLLDLIVGHGFFHSQAVKELPKDGVFQVWAFGTEEVINKVVHDLKGKAEIYRWNDLAVEIAPLNSGKGSGINMAKHYFDSNVKTYGFGDGVNDFSMMEVVDVSIAMGNAVEELKNKCDYVTSDCDKQGVEKGLEHFNII